MKKSLMMVAAAAAILPMGAQAAPADGTVSMDAASPEICAIRGFSVDGGGSSFNNPNGAADTGTLSLSFAETSVDGTTARAVSTTKTLTLDGFCNYKDHILQLRSSNNGMTLQGDPGPVSGDFNRRIRYEASISNWGSTATIGKLEAKGSETNADRNIKDGDRATVDRAVNTSDAQKAVLTIKTLANTNSNPLLQGTYNDVLTIRLGGGF